MRAKKRSRFDSDGDAPSAKRGRPRQQSTILTRYPPLKDTGDDDITLSRNLDALRKEIRKDHPNRERVLSLCQQTFSRRREDVLDDSDSNSASALMEKYNELHRSYVVSNACRVYIMCIIILLAPLRAKFFILKLL